MLLVRLAAASLGLLMSVAGSAAQSLRVFNDWHAACDNARSCALLGLSPNDVNVFSFLQLRRGADAGAPPDVSLVFTFETELPELPLDITFAPPLSLDVFPPEPVARIGRDGLMRLDLSPDASVRFIDVLRRADQIQIRRLDDAPVEESATIVSLTGAAAALRWMDEQQQRVGTVTALVARGERPASAVPAAPAPPTHTAAAYQPRQLETKAPEEVKAIWRSACPDWEMAGDGEDVGYQIAGETILWQLPCSRAAYNFGTLFLLQTRGGPPREVQFERPLNGRLVPEAGELISGEFSDEERTVFFFAKGRGLGDCGARGSYLWDGRAFRLTMWQEMAECRGAPLDLWPVIWRAQARMRR